MIELVDGETFNLFVSVIPFKVQDSFYYCSLNDDYPRPVWWQQPAAGTPRTQVNSIHLCPHTCNEYMINDLGKRVVDTKLISITRTRE